MQVIHSDSTIISPSLIKVFFLLQLSDSWKQLGAWSSKVLVDVDVGGVFVSMNGDTLSPTDTTIYLGVNINNKLLLDHHIKNISAAANRMLGFLWRTMHKCPKNLKERAYKTIICLKVEYCASIWDPRHGKYIESIEKVQRKQLCD